MAAAPTSAVATAVIAGFVAADVLPILVVTVGS
jgi:hypothetical protein